MFSLFRKYLRGLVWVGFFSPQLSLRCSRVLRVLLIFDFLIFLLFSSSLAACIHTYQARNARYLNLAVFIVLCVCLSNLTTSYLYSLVSSTIRKKRRERGEGGRPGVIRKWKGRTTGLGGRWELSSRDT